MSIDLKKRTGINLKKGSSISLKKEENFLNQICVGVNWGAIQRKSMFNAVNFIQDVDLDVILTAFDDENRVVYSIYHKNPASPEQAIQLSKDDRQGDLKIKKERVDNEFISLNLQLLPSYVTQIVFFLNSHNGQSFSEIPYADMRLYEGTPDNIQDVLATLYLSDNEKFADYFSMILGKLVKVNNKWEFKAIGEPTEGFTTNQINLEIQKLYLD